MRLTFAPEETTLSPAGVAAIKEFVAAAPAGDTTSYNVIAYASGKSDDPSVSRRLSLSRALAVRSTLMAEGIASTRIYVRALGSQAGSGPPDRVDISLLGANGTAPR
jgi:outer membrane protein OmpA-like peptidoglycan-associated protein